MTSINSKNIFDVVKKKYAPNQPEKNHKIDPVYSLFDRDDPLPKCQELAFFTDTSICTGCKSCEVACKQWNQLESDPYHWSGDSYDNTGDLSANNWRHVKFIERFPEKNAVDRPAPATIDSLLKEPKAGKWLFMSDQCKHCRTSPCHEACPTGAIVRNEFGGVYYQTDICMGCGMCVAACPFGVPEISPKTGHSMKCDSLNSFYLLMDKPEVYGLPSDPVTPTKYMAGDYLRGAATLILCAAAVAACLV